MTKQLPVLFALALAACGSPTDAPVDPDAKRRFIEKTHRALRPTAPPLDAAEIDALLEQEDADIVRSFYADPRAREAVYKLSLAYLGAPIDQVRQNGTWAARPFSFAPAAAAARAFREGTDPMAQLLTTYVEPARGMVMPVDEYIAGFYFPNATFSGTNAQKRATLGQAAVDETARFRATIAALPEPFTNDAMCEQYNNSIIGFVGFILPQLLGVPAPVTENAQPFEMSEPEFFPLDDACFFGEPMTRDVALARIDKAGQLFGGMVTRLEPIMAGWEADLEGAFDKVDYNAIGFYSSYGSSVFGRTQFYTQFWQLAQNSSTNYDRRRGAYVLDRYFCDDLKPVGAALPIVHNTDKHASDPSCASCHFKLDPMAGFFRRVGYFGIEFNEETLNQNGGQIIFDDFASLTYSEYEKAWLAPPGAGRQFDVGYIRSTRDPSANSYGDTLQDLDTLLKTAPEVERCFAQRMFEYFNGADQAVDPGFLDQVSTEMKAGGADRLQYGIVRILTGETFRAEDRNTNVCYDLAPGTDTAHRPPCEVASILRTHCGSCHGGGTVQAGLDLSTWVSRDGGFGFTSSVGRIETFTRMLDRVTTSDLALQMPQARDMPLRQREQLALWLQKMIDEN
jgi:hypothetical protein